MCSSKSAGTPAGASGRVELRKILIGHLLRLALDLAHRVEILAPCALVGGSELAAHATTPLVHEVEQAARLRDDRFALGRRVALAEQAVEQLARVVLHRQRLARRAERDRRSEAAAELRDCTHRRSTPSPRCKARATGNGVSCADVPRRDLVRRDPARLSPVFGQNGDVQLQPRAGIHVCTPAPSAALLRRPLTTVMWLLNGANGARICGSSKARPVAAGDPLVDDGAVRQIEEADLRLRRAQRSARAPCRPGSSRRATAAKRTRRAREERSARQVFLGDEHGETSLGRRCRSVLRPVTAQGLPAWLAHANALRQPPH